MKRWKEKNGKIYARFTYTDSTGKQREMLEKAESKTDAKEKAKEMERKYKKSPESFGYDKILDEYLDSWLVSQKQSVSERTLEDAKGYLRIHVRPILGKKQLSKIRPLDVQGMIDSMKAKELSPRTVKHAHSVLS